MDYEVMTKQQEKTAQRLQLRRIVSAVSILIGFSGIVLAAVLSTQQTTVSNNLPQYEPLREGTYVPAQVVFKVKKGKSADVALKNLLAKKHTLYQKKSDRTFLPLSEAKLAENNPAYEKKTITLHKKSLHKIFPESEINSNTREKIFRRPGVSEPSKTYDELGLGEWYVATVDEAHADIQQLSWHLESDSKNIEFAGANLYAETKVALENASSEPINNSDSAVTTTACSNPNDPYSCSVGNVPVVPSDQWYLRAIQAEQAWQISTGSSDTIIAVVDTGVDTLHPDIKEKIWLNTSEDKNRNNCADYWGVQIIQTDCHGNMVLGDLDGVDDDLNGYKDDLNGMHFGWESIFPGVNYRLGPVDTNGHGTIDAGIIGAAQNTNTPIGISGVCPDCLIMPLQVNFDSVQVAKAWQYAVDNGATIINFSGQFDPREEETLFNLLHSAAYYVDRAGVTLVAASGNENIDFVDAGFFPGIEPTTINVGSSTVQGNRSWHNPNPCTTNTGSSSGSNWGNNLDLLAPGERILAPMGYNYSNTLHEPLCLLGTISCSQPTVYYSCDLVGIVANNPATKEGYMFSSGTSHAAPIVSGIAGLMRSVNKALTPYDIKGILQTTAEHIESVIDENGLTIDFTGAWNPYAGYGLTNAQAAVQEAYNRRPDFGITITPGTTPIAAVDANKIRYDIWVENRGWTTATRVPYKVVNADTNETVYSGVTPTLYGNAGGWLNETVTLSSSVPSRLKVIIDPENLYSEPFENDNTSPVISVIAYGTPYINHLEKQDAKINTTLSFVVQVTDVNTPTDQVSVTASSLPPGGTFSGVTFSWTPTAETPSNTYFPIFTAMDPTGLTSSHSVPIKFINTQAVGLSNFTETAQNGGYLIQWSSGTIATDARLDYGSSTSYGHTAYNSERLTNHEFWLSAREGETYHYQVTSCTNDQPRLCGVSQDRIFTVPTFANITSSHEVFTSLSKSANWNLTQESNQLTEATASVLTQTPLTVPPPASYPNLPALNDIHLSVDDTTVSVGWTTDHPTYGNVFWGDTISTSTKNGRADHTLSTVHGFTISIPSGRPVYLFVQSDEPLVGANSSPLLIAGTNISGGTGTSHAWNIELPTKTSSPVYLNTPIIFWTKMCTSMPAPNSWCRQTSQQLTWPPSFISYQLPSATIIENTPFQYVFFVPDINLSGRTVSLTGLPPNALFENNVLSWTPLKGQANTYQAYFSFVDQGKTVRYVSTLTVVNTPPAVDPIAPIIGNIGKTVSTTLRATDQQNESVGFHVLNPPTGLTVDQVSGKLSWTIPSSVVPGTVTKVSVRACDERSMCSPYQEIVITINQPPIIPTLSSVTAYRGTTFSYQFPVATDPEGKAMTYSAKTLPPGATFDPATRKMSWTLAANTTFQSSYTVQYTATDADGGSATTSLKISVQTFSSFLSGTSIRLADGDQVMIEDIRGGEQVRTYNPNTKLWNVGTINGVFTYVAEDYYVLNDAVRVTSKHPVLTARGWVQVQDLRIGDRVKTETGYTPILSQRKIQQAATVYNLEVSGDETYVAGGYVVHNKKNPYTQTGL